MKAAKFAIVFNVQLIYKYLTEKYPSQISHKQV